MQALANNTVLAIILQYGSVSNQHIAPFQITVLHFNYISIKLDRVWGDKVEGHGLGIFTRENELARLSKNHAPEH